MSVKKYTRAINHVDGINVGNNEIITKYTLNRNLQKLIENDEGLVELFKKINGELHVTEYVDGNTYNVGDFIWFYDQDIKDLKLLKCIRNNNKKKPKYVNGSYDQTGWYDENEYFDISKSGIDNTIGVYINNNIRTHQLDLKFHPHGKIKQSVDGIDGVFMKNTLTNANPSREHIFYPYKTYGMLSDDVILNGFYRMYENGYIEYDIIFRLGYCGKEIYDGQEYTTLTCNNIQNLDYESDYFYGLTDADIFNYKNILSNNFSIIGNTILRNRNDFVNVYSGLIKFPVDFIDKNYIIMTTLVTSLDNNINLSRINPSANQLCFMNREINKITAFLVTFSKDNFTVNGYNSQNGGLVANSFRCKIVGFCNR